MRISTGSSVSGRSSNSLVRALGESVSASPQLMQHSHALPVLEATAAAGTSSATTSTSSTAARAVVATVAVVSAVVSAVAAIEVQDLFAVIVGGLGRLLGLGLDSCVVSVASLCRECAHSSRLVSSAGAAAGAAAVVSAIVVDVSGSRSNGEAIQTLYIRLQGVSRRMQAGVVRVKLSSGDFLPALVTLLARSCP